MFNQGFTTQLSKVYSRMEGVLECIHVLDDYVVSLGFFVCFVGVFLFVFFCLFVFFLP